MLVPFTWKVTGWFMVGWSPEFPDRRSPAAALFRRGSGRLSATSTVSCTSWKRTANTSAPTSAMAAPWSATVSSAPSTDGAGDRTAPIDTSRISRTGPTAHCGCGCFRSGSSTTACSSGISRTARSRSGRCRTSFASSRNSRPIRRPTTARIRSSPGAPSANRCIRRQWPRTPPTVPISSTCTTPR